MKIKDTLLFQLPFFILEKISRFILKNEIKEEKEKNIELRKDLDVLKKEKENIFTENNTLTASFNRFKEIIKANKNNTLELTTTKNNKLVIISYSKKKVFDRIELFSESENNGDWDSFISFSDRGKEIHIEDFQSKTKGKGFGGVLMDFTIKKALEENITSVTGDLSNQDSKNFDWLIPFYQSFGFECVLYKDVGKMIISEIVGEIKLNLNKTLPK